MPLQKPENSQSGIFCLRSLLICSLSRGLLPLLDNTTIHLLHLHVIGWSVPILCQFRDMGSTPALILMKLFPVFPILMDNKKLSIIFIDKTE